MNLRPREPEKELFGNFRFKARTTNDRIYDCLIQHHGSEENFVNPKKHKKSPSNRLGIGESVEVVSSREQLESPSSNQTPSARAVLKKRKTSTISTHQHKNISIHTLEGTDWDKTYFKGAEDYFVNNGSMRDPEKRVQKLLNTKNVT